jgi:hypothetical protein
MPYGIYNHANKSLITDLSEERAYAYIECDSEDEENDEVVVMQNDGHYHFISSAGYLVQKGKIGYYEVFNKSID